MAENWHRVVGVLLTSVATVLAISGVVSGHVVYVTDEDQPGDGVEFLIEMGTDPVVLGLLSAMAIGTLGFFGAYLRWRPFAVDIAALRSVLEGYRDLLPWLLRLGFGLPLVGAGFVGDFYNPIVEPIFAPELIRIGQIALGFALLFGVATRAAALLALGWYLVSLPLVPELLASPEWIPGLLAIALVGSGRPSADQVFEEVAATEGTWYGTLDPIHERAPILRRYLAPARPYVPTFIRIGLGLTFIGLGIVEKLLAPAMAADVVHQYNLTVIPLPVEYWIVFAGLGEITVGLFILLGFFTRLSAIGAMAIFVLALFAIPDDPIMAHIGLFSLASALVITGGGALSIDRLWLERSDRIHERSV